ncbi:uncharacterized protein LOC104421549 [Eucalyptus grandis]|uniref:uncharacterized protein LOC104421549 n=1 Tax=Eucalyptus grandis TaxID=71139 RepID=UPI00192E9D93|nr:uncharacterized protein LOC104421549 [Eucalyptus grandis]
MAGALVGGAVLSASLQVLFDRLASCRLTDCIWRQNDEEVLLKKLKASLVFAEAVLSDAEHKQITDLTAKGWLNQLEETVADAQNLLNGIEARDSPRRLRGGSRSKLLEDMLDRLEVMARQKDAFGFIELGVQPLQTSPTTSLVQERNIYGRDEDMEAIVGLLLSDDAPSDPIGVITIIGVPGIGKTILIQSVYNDNSVKGYFDFRIWICASNRLDVYSITKTILEAITMVSCDIKDLNILQLRLIEEVIGRKLLLILDDLCTEDCLEWNTMQSPLRFCAPASKILVTTRSEITAAMTCTLPAYHLSPLPYEVCWLIFTQHAFDSGFSAPDPNLEAVGREVVKKCRGLPLVAKTLGVLFRSKPNHGEWNEILKDSMWDASPDLSSFVQTLSIRSGIGKWRRKLLESQHEENFFPGVLNQFRGTYPYIKIKKAWLSKILVLWIIILSIVSGLVYKTVNDYQTTKMKEALRSMCSKRAWMLQNQYTAIVNHFALAMMARVYYQENAINTNQMREALDNYMDNDTCGCPLYSGVAYAEHVGKRGCQWQINMTIRGQPPPVEERKAYTNVLANALMNSRHMTTGKEDRGLVVKARPVEKAVLSGPFRLLQSNQTGVILTYPHYRSKLSPSMGLEERFRAITGYIGVVFEFESFVESILWQLGSGTVLVTIYDITNSSRSLMYGHNYVKSDWPMMHESKLELGDPFRKHQMNCRYRDAASLSWIPAIVAVSIFIIGLIVPCVLYAAAIHIVKIRQASLRIRGLGVQLRDANTANSQLRADASEIKQPAYTIIGTLAMLLETELSSIQRGYIQIAQACGKRQIALVDRALELPNLPVITHTN